MRRGPKPAKSKEAKPSVARKSPKNEDSKVRDLEKRLAEALRDKAEALERETATSEILRVIASSPTDERPVFETIVASALRLLNGHAAGLRTLHGDELHMSAFTSTTPSGDSALAQGPIAVIPVSSSPHFTRVVKDRTPLAVEDTETESGLPPGLRQVARARGYRSGLNVPLLRGETVLGVLNVTRVAPGPFSAADIALLQTFADQAVIAIENARLFNETKEALERQTATGDILKVIASSPTDIQPVLDTVAERAARLCESSDAEIFRRDGARLLLVAHHGPIPSRTPVVPLIRETFNGRTVLDGRTLHIVDLQSETDEFPRGSEIARQHGTRAQLSVPLMREGVAIGTISLRRAEARLFTDRQVALLQIFADQAVIAIENVRLFKELRASNSELKTALDKQTATSDILRVISRSQTDVQPVFDTILASAVRLLQGYSGVVTRVAGDQLDLAALTRTTDAGDAAVRALYPERLDSQATHVRATRNRAPLNIADAQSDPQLPEVEHTRARVRGYRSHVVVPLLRQDEAIGTIGVTRREPGGFNDDEIALLQIFADQAVIAIENVRLFTELQQKNGALTQAHAQVSESLEQQTATSEILEVMSQSQTDAQPVFEAIVKSALRLCDGFFSIVYRFDGEMMGVAADHQVNPRASAALRALYPAPARRDHIVGRALLDRRRHHIADVATDPELGGNRNVFMSAFPYRTALAVPMLLRGVPIGAIAIGRSDVRPFTDKQVEVLETFADQAVIAIENVRLFKELETRTGELTKSVEKLTALSEVSRAVSSTLDVETVLDTIVSRANQLAGADGCGIYEYNENAQMFQVRATHNFDAAFVTRLRAMPLHKGEGAAGRATEAHEPIQIADIAVPGAYESRVRDLLIGAGYRALLSVPLVREEQIIGSLSLLRKMPGEYSPEVVEVLKTFATQSALAIQNARLFREIEDKSRQLEVVSQHKSEFLANMSHELRTPLNAIIGFSEVLTERMFGELNEKQEEYSKDIHASGQHLLSLINDMLDLSKIEAGRMELELSDFHLPTALDSALTLVRERAGRRSIALHTNIDNRLGQIQADERKVRQVVLNLLSNAIKFTPEGGRIEVGAAPKDGFVEVSVSDTGVGIAPEDQEAVFEEFRQVGTADKKVEGTGLGLTLCRKFVELHGGRIWVKSELGMGSTFTFTLPLRSA
jgi:two-component system, NtrC family, sensor kinase